MSNQPSLPVNDAHELMHSALHVLDQVNELITKHGQLPQLIITHDLAREIIKLNNPVIDTTKAVQAYLKVQRAKAPATV